MQEHEKWLSIAQEDLGVAKSILKDEFFSSVAYHCQQTAEKALKAYLIFKKHKTSKTHDLIKLNQVCSCFDKNFYKLCDTVEELNPFATKFRYPSEYDIPDLNDAQQAIKQAQKVMRFVKKAIIIPGTGQTDLTLKS